MKITVDCKSEIIKRMSHSNSHEVRLMVDENTSLFEILSEYYNEDDIKFKVTIEEVG